MCLTVAVMVSKRSVSGTRHAVTFACAKIGSIMAWNPAFVSAIVAPQASQSSLTYVCRESIGGPNLLTCVRSTGVATDSSDYNCLISQQTPEV